MAHRNNTAQEVPEPIPQLLTIDRSVRVRKQQNLPTQPRQAARSRRVSTSQQEEEISSLKTTDESDLEWEQTKEKVRQELMRMAREQDWWVKQMRAQQEASLQAIMQWLDSQPAGQPAPQPVKNRAWSPMDVSQKLLLTMEEAAAILSIGARTLYKLVAEGKIKSIKVAGLRSRRIRRETLNEFICRCSEGQEPWR